MSKEARGAVREHFHGLDDPPTTRDGRRALQRTALGGR